MEPTTGWRTRKIFSRPWQDLAFAVGGVVFLASLAPMLFDSSAHVPVATALATAATLYAFLPAHVSYRNWVTVGLTALTATLWVLIGLGVSL